MRDNLRVMDHSAISLCRENHIPIRVLNIFGQGNMARAIRGESVGTLVSE
jgi:uridylate kinase